LLIKKQKMRVKNVINIGFIENIFMNPYLLI